MWLNVRGFGPALDEVAARRMTAGAIATTASAVVLLGIAVAHYSFGRRGSRVGAALFAIAVIGSLALPLAARGPAVPLPLGSYPVNLGRPARPPSSACRVAALRRRVARIHLAARRGGPAAELRPAARAGAAIDLATIRPTQPDPVWAAVATGMYPSKNGVRSAASYYARGDNRAVDLLPDHCFSHALVRLGFVRTVPNSSAAWRARPLWSVLGDAGVSVGIVRWPLTYPAQPVLGFLVTDRFHQLIGSMFEFDNRAAYPPEVVPIAREPFSSAAAAPESAEVVDEPGSLRDRAYSLAMQSLAGQWTPQFTALRYQALDLAGHHHWSAAQPRSGADPAEEERRRSAQVLERSYLTVDAEVGAAIHSLAPGTCCSSSADSACSGCTR